MPPIYLYQHPETEEIKEILQGMNDPHVFEEDNIQWNRVYTVPRASIDTKINPFSANEFVAKTGSKKGTVGEVMDLSAELSEKRAESTGGTDPVKQKLFNDYKNKTGKKHLLDKPKVIETKIAKIEL